jgi:hypothetical protein
MARRAADGALGLPHGRLQPGAGVGIELPGLWLGGQSHWSSLGQFGDETLVLALALVAPAAACPGQHRAMRRQRRRKVTPCGHLSTVASVSWWRTLPGRPVTRTGWLRSRAPISPPSARSCRNAARPSSRPGRADRADRVGLASPKTSCVLLTPRALLVHVRTGGSHVLRPEVERSLSQPRCRDARGSVRLWTGAEASVRNHDQKIKDISRSVLPSTGRKSARVNRRIIHQRQRARELTAATAYRRDSDPDSVTPDLRGTYAPDITGMVWSRRAQDKVGPLVRWAEATIAADPVLRSAPRASQVAYFARRAGWPARPGRAGDTAPRCPDAASAAARKPRHRGVHREDGTLAGGSRAGRRSRRDGCRAGKPPAFLR